MRTSLPLNGRNGACRMLTSSCGWIHARHQIRPASIDAAISAESPNPENDSELHQIILTHMIHGPCGSLNPSSPCMRDGACSKMYPKEFLDQTESGIDGYPHYRRRKPEEGGHHATKTIQGEQITIDNRWVVPHSPYLCRVFNCHINLELCTSIKSIKYVLKYVHKGCDMACLPVIRSATAVWLRCSGCIIPFTQICRGVQ